MKILQVGKFYPIRGGVEKVMYDLTLGLSLRGIRCDMLCAVTERYPSGVITLNNYAQLFCMPTWIKWSATMISPAMIRKLRKIQHEYNIIHIHHPDPMACLALFFSRYKGKVVLHWHSDIIKQKVLMNLYGSLQRWLIKRADRIVGTTPVYVQQSPFLAQVQNKVTDVPIGIDRLVADPDLVTQIKEQYAGKKIVFSLGRLVEYKGYEYLIKAAQYLDDNCMILIGGKGPLKDELQQLIEEQGVNERVKLLGFIPDDNEVAAYFMACDVFCLSSIWKTEAFGIVQIEAMSCGKPVVATRIEGSGVSWINVDGVSGYNVEPENAEALAGAIKSIFSDSQRYAELSAGACQRYETMFTQKKMVDKCLKLYNDTLKETVSLPNELFFKEVKALLSEGKQVKIPVKGNSMRPFIQNEDTVALVAVTNHPVRWGDIVLARTATTCSIVLHRVAYKKKNRLWLIGDAHSRQREHTTVEDVLAVTVGAYRNGNKLNMDSFGWRCAVVLWFLALPVRGYLLKMYDMLNRKKKKI